MSAYREFTGKTVEEALKNARDAFGAGLDDLDFEILTPGSRGVLGIGVFGGTAAKAADNPPSATGGVAVGTANASGIRASYDFPGFLVVDQFYDVGGPVAQANVNSSGAGTAFASFPYPGDTIVNAPALANVGTGQAFPFTYPLYVVTDGSLTPKASAATTTLTTSQQMIRNRGPSARGRGCRPRPIPSALPRIPRSSVGRSSTRCAARLPRTCARMRSRRCSAAGRRHPCPCTIQ